jgi:hypothetical protein
MQKSALKPLATSSSLSWDQICDKADNVDATGAGVAQQLLNIEQVRFLILLLSILSAFFSGVQIK